MKTLKRLAGTALALPLITSLAVACGGGGDDNGGPVLGTDNKVVVNEIKVPTNANQVAAFSLDLNGDGQREANKLGSALQVVAAMSGGKIDLQGEVNKAMRSGSVIFLGNLRATDLTNASNAGLWLFLGANPNPSPCTNPADIATCGKHLINTATFSVAPSGGKPYSLLKGKIQGGVFTGGPGNVTLLLKLSDTSAPVEVPMSGVRIQATVGPNGLADGIMAGAVKEDDMKNKVLPGVHGLITQLIARDCNVAEGFAKPPNMCCKPQSTGETLVNNIFLTNAEDRTKYGCTVPLDVFTSNPFVGTLLAPDVRLFDDAGNFKPQTGSNVKKDSVSLGLGITGLKLGEGGFTMPAEAEAQAQ